MAAQNITGDLTGRYHSAARIEQPLGLAPVSLRPRMIATSALAKEYGARTLFSDVSLQLNAGSRYGLVGANGSGKSTFMRILAGDEEASAGTVTIVKRARVGVLRQDRF